MFFPFPSILACAGNRGDTIAIMAKFKPVKAKNKSTPRVQGGLPCVILLISGIILVMLFMYWILSSSH
jgi:hypothetical protein